MGCFFVVSNYLPVFMFVIMGFFFGIAPLVANKILAPSHAYEEKNSPYECGFLPFEDARISFDVKYYLIAIMFIVFDLEIAFMFPWAVVLDKLNDMAYLSMAIFLVELIIGFIYVWKKGALEWE
jgi:NADH-quinone oxidoreductase subunit A